MNGTLAKNIRRQLLPALERSQGFAGVYTRGTSSVGKSLVVIPQPPDWLSEEEKAASIEQYAAIAFTVSLAQWTATGYSQPQQNDRLTVTLADGVSRTYALLPAKGMRPWSIDATGSHYILRMKWVGGPPSQIAH